MESTKLANTQREYETEEAQTLRLNMNKELLMQCFGILHDNINAIIDDYFKGLQEKENVDVGVDGLKNLIIGIIPGMKAFAGIAIVIEEGLNTYQKVNINDKRDEIVNKINDMFTNEIERINNNPYLMF